jgi:hypothetical protein
MTNQSSIADPDEGLVARLIHSSEAENIMPWKRGRNLCAEAADRIQSLTAELARLRELLEKAQFAATTRGMALAPFAEACSNCIDDEPDEASTWEHAVTMDLTFRDFRGAHAVLKHKDKSDG